MLSDKQISHIISIISIVNYVAWLNTKVNGIEFAKIERLFTVETLKDKESTDVLFKLKFPSMQFDISMEDIENSIWEKEINSTTLDGEQFRFLGIENISVSKVEQLETAFKSVFEAILDENKEEE